MLERIKYLTEEISNLKADLPGDVEQLRLKYLSKKGLISVLFDEFRNVPAEQKKEMGLLLNHLKNAAQLKIENLKSAFEGNKEANDESADLSLPVDHMAPGTRHPLSIVRNEIIRIFGQIGYTVAEGPEIEDDWHNFSALNFPPEHPARDMQDTFFIARDPEILLRTHTSSVQIRTMETEQPPIRKIFPGRVFRNEAISARAHCIFHQVEGLYVDKNVSFMDLKQTLLYFAREMFGESTEIRLRPSFFPFTEPSGELDVSCNICGGKGCNICKYTGWVEILGCGMVDPAVLDNCGIDSTIYTGFAFGMGIERVTLLKYQVRDLRLFFENDLRFLKQFTGTI
ncbi:MAG: phenylalanine--tRNA ligase subunit alpha [Bacteroidetes bacterium]|nr:phenylalanine--tRNA ligase subunit alpha [Bacteroidota bacterium]